MGSKGSKQPSTTTTSSTTGPPGWFTDAYAKPLFNTAQNAYQQSRAVGPYQGDFYAQYNPQQKAAIAGLGKIGEDISGPQYWQPTYQLGQDTIAGKYLDPSTNKYLAASASAATDPVYEQLNRMLGSQLDTAVGGGAFGPTYAGINADTSRLAARDAAGVRAGIYAPAYQQERQLQMMAPSLIDQSTAMRTAGPKLQLTAGTAMQSDEQAKLDAAFRRNQYDTAYPFQGLSDLASIYGSLPIGSSSTGTTTQTQESQGEGLGGALSGGLGGAGLGLGLATALAPFTGGTSYAALLPFLLAGGGALAGGAGGYMSGRPGMSGPLSTSLILALSATSVSLPRSRAGEE